MTDTSSVLPQADMEVDASGLKCPLPILRAKKALAQLESGQVLKVVTTDTHAVRDSQAFAKKTGNTLEAQQATAATVAHYLCRSCRPWGGFPFCETSAVPSSAGTRDRKE